MLFLFDYDKMVKGKWRVVGPLLIPHSQFLTPHSLSPFHCMSTLSVPVFLDYLRRSELVGETRLAEALVQIKKELGEEKWTDPEAVGGALVAKGLITRWHMRQLFKKRYKGFFLRQYKILSHLGAGGMSTVYLAEHTMMHRQVAIKVLPKKKLEKSAYLDRFVREAQAIASLDHPNIVRAYDIDQEGDVHYIVMEYFDGRNLQNVVETDGAFVYETAADYIRQAALALEYAHQVGVIHRDVKPGNLLVSKTGLVKVLDLGLALLDENMFEGRLTAVQEDRVLGTADYLAPEQGIDSHQIDARADIYGLGGVLYFCLTGHAPFPEGTVAQKLLAHQRSEPESIFKIRPDVPDDLVQLCRKMMSKKPDDRQQSALEVVADMQNWLIMHGFAEENTFPPLETLRATPQTLGAVPIASQADRFKKLLQQGHWSLELGDDSAESSIGLGNESAIRLQGGGSSSTSSGMMRPPGGSSAMMSPLTTKLTTKLTAKTAKSTNEDEEILTSARIEPAEKDPLLFALHEIGRSPDEIVVGTNSKTSQFVPKSQDKPKLQEIPPEKPVTKSRQPLPPWYKQVPFWFWCLFGASVFTAVFLAGILVAVLLFFS